MKNRKNSRKINLLIGFVVLVVTLMICICIISMEYLFDRDKKIRNQVSEAVSSEVNIDSAQMSEIITDGTEVTLTEDEKQLSEEEIRQKAEEEEAAARRVLVLERAKRLAQGYDYDTAIEVLKADEAYGEDTEFQELITEYEEAKSNLVPYGAFESADEISHVFFHSLIVDTSKAFDGDHISNGYNYWMTTTTEFKRMLEQMYARGYVLVSICDIAYEDTLEDGTKGMVKGEILLPPDKKPFVLSQDDTNYYEYMKTDGFASRLVIDEDGFPACEIELDGKTQVARDYDVVPILEKFIEEHPDFSYHGARGIIGVTGYEGVIGYRTNDKDSETYEEDIKQATEVANRLKELGWEFASHSYGHGHMGKESASYVKNDSVRWDSEVASIIGKTDIYLYPYGEDIVEGIGAYSGEKYETLYDLGFRYYCGVYAYPWIQIKDAYVRMTRRNLDGYTMNFHKARLEDLFDVDSTIDSARPEFK